MVALPDRDQLLLLLKPACSEAPDSGFAINTRSSCFTFIKVPRLGSETYHLKIGHYTGGRAKIEVKASQIAGLRYAVATFRQLLHFYGNSLPECTVQDAPAFPVRGVMLDISRDRVPTLEQIHEVVEQLAGWKINHLQLYTEHTFAYRGHEVVWQGFDPFTPEEIEDLDYHCQSVGITLAANQSTFGHMERWLRQRAYMHLAETTGRWRCLGRRMTGPFSLAPADPMSLELVEDLISQLKYCFRSGLLNINCDETYDVGQGRSRALVKREGFGKVYSRFVRKIAEAAMSRGFQPLFWADMALSHPEALDDLPRDMIALAWGYEPDADFDYWGQMLSEHGFKWWVCPGTSSWRSITGRTTERRENIRQAVRSGIKGGADGLLVTDWGDSGHRQQWPVSLIGLAESAAAMWNPELTLSEEALSRHAFGDATGKVAGWLSWLGDADLPLRQAGGKRDDSGLHTPIRNASALFKELDRRFGERGRIGLPEDWIQVEARLEELSSSLPRTRDELVIRELRQSAREALFAARLALLRRGHYHKRTAMRVRLKEDLEEMIREHRALWQRRSRYGGLEDSCRHYEHLRQELA